MYVPVGLGLGEPDLDLYICLGGVRNGHELFNGEDLRRELDMF